MSSIQIAAIDDSEPVAERSPHGIPVEPLATEPADQLIFAASPAAGSLGTRRTIRASLKPLIVFMTSQYVIVTALVALAAVTVASEAAKIINAKLELILAALKRL